MSIYSLVFDCRFSAKKDQYETVDIVGSIYHFESRSRTLVVQ